MNLVMPTYELNGQRIVKWTDIEVVISSINEEMALVGTCGKKEFEQRFRDSFGGVVQRFQGETIQEKCESSASAGRR